MTQDEWYAAADLVRCFLESMVLPWLKNSASVANPEEEGHWCDTGGGSQ